MDYILQPFETFGNLKGYEDLKESNIDASLITEEQILNEDAAHICSTIEMLDFDL